MESKVGITAALFCVEVNHFFKVFSMTPQAIVTDEQL